MKKLAALTTLALGLPFVAFAQFGTLAPIQSLLVSIGNLVSLAIPIAIGCILIFTIYEGYHFIHDPKSENRSKLIAAVVVLFVIISIWGLVHLLQTAVLGGTPSNQINAPHFPQN